MSHPQACPASHLRAYTVVENARGRSRAIPVSIHNRGLVGHVEEIAVAKEHQGKGLGLTMIQTLDAVGRNVGCYKNILNCGAKNEPFYVKCGYHNSGTEMSRYFEAAKDDFHRG